jgi:hypothetical protein
MRHTRTRNKRGQLARIVFVALTVCGVARTVAAQACDRFAGLSAPEQTEILNSGSRSDPECTAFLLKRVGDAHYQPASRAIVKYLDFEWPRDEHRAVAIARRPWLGDYFPAVYALFELEEGAVPAITELLASEKSSNLARRNGIDTLLMIYSRNQAQAVRTLLLASREASDATSGAALAAAAVATAGRCAPITRAACQDTLFDRTIR